MAQNIKINKFKVDRNLAYLIQQITGESTEDILAHFLGIATYMGESAIQSKKAIRLNKELVLFYKETPIPYKLQVYAGWRDDMRYLETAYVSVNVLFPKKARAMDVTDLITKVTEIGLGLIEEDNNLPKFDKPILKSPKCLRDVRIKQNESRE